jgi:alkaline phosphatase
MKASLRTVLASLLLLIVISAAAAIAAAAPGPSAPQAFPGVKNVILFISDGTGPEQLELGRGYNGGWLNLDSIPWAAQGTLDTRSLDGITDSAAAATALATGYETHNGWLSMVPAGAGATSVPTVLETAMARSKWAGLVTDVYVTDATPAAFGAHVTDRGLYEEIATQLASRRPQMLMGGNGYRGTAPLKNLSGVTYVTRLRELQAYLSGAKPWVAPLYGFWAGGPMTYDLDRSVEGVTAVEPTLSQLTQAALADLSRQTAGFFLMVEGGAIDWAAHSRDPGSVGAEVQGYDAAVKAAWDWAKGRSDTLLVVTSDHETGGLQVDGKTDYAAIHKQSATTEFMWGLIAARKSTIRQTLAKYAGFTPTAAEEALVAANGEMGISDVLAARDKVAWGWSGKDDGDHTLTPVQIRAWGPGSGVFAVTGAPNELVGQQLLLAAGQ